MALPTPSDNLSSPSHSTLHRERVNVKSFGAVGDNVTNDTAAIQAAIDTASAPAGTGIVFFPPGNYHLNSKLTLQGDAVTLTGGARGLGGVAGDTPGAQIVGTFTGPLIERVVFGNGQVIIEDLSLYNAHATGIVLSLSGMQAPSGIFRCDIIGWKGIEWGANTFGVLLENLHINRSGIGTLSTSIGMSLNGHMAATAIDVGGYGVGVNIAEDSSVKGSTLVGFRIENCIEGIHIGPLGGQGLLIGGMSTEANDTDIHVHGGGGFTIAGASLMGTPASPAGGSIDGILIDSCSNAVFSGINQQGSYSNSFIKITNQALGLQDDLVFIGSGGLSGWDIETLSPTYTLIGCTGTDDVVRAPVIATASLPAAAAREDGRIVVEDGGAGNRNLVIYGGAQRFRIDGGAAI